MKCPSCKETSLVLSERQGIEIDYCPECRGVWLDRGELDKILEKSMREQRPAGENTYDREREHYDSKKGQYPHKRRKSFFEELFD